MEASDPARERRPLTGSRMSSRTVLLVATGAYVLSFTLDFRGGQGASATQIAMAAINLASFLTAWGCNRFRLPRRGPLAYLLWAWAGFFLVGSLGAVVSGVEPARYLRTAYPFALFLASLIVAWAASRRADLERWLVRMMSAGAVVSLLYTLWRGIHLPGSTLVDVRYHIVSPLILLLIAASMFDVFIGSGNRIRGLVLLASSLVVITLSLTRGYLLVMAAIIASLLVAWLLARPKRRRAPRFLTRMATLGTAVVVIAVAATWGISSGTPGRWLQRAFGAHREATLLTRVAAVEGQWTEMTAHPASLLVGRGFGQDYGYSARVLAPVAGFLGPRFQGVRMWYPGEFMWFSILFYGGLVVGPIVILVVLYCAWRVLGLLSRLFTVDERGRHAAAWVAALGFFAYLGTTFTANPFIVRLSPMYLGLLVGIALTTRAGSDPARGPAGVERAQLPGSGPAPLFRPNSSGKSTPE